jgi:hypothetical protein
VTNQPYRHPAPPTIEGPTATGYLAILLSWAVPGLGHIIVGEKRRGLIFAFAIHGLFALGLLIGGIRAINPPDQPIWTYTQYLAGWPMLIAGRAEKDWMPQPGEKNSKFERLLGQYEMDRPTPGDDSQIDARKAYAQKKFAENPILTYHPKVQDIGSVYCGIAGMLNLLVMFDVLLRITGTDREAAADKTESLPAAAEVAK